MEPKRRQERILLTVEKLNTMFISAKIKGKAAMPLRAALWPMLLAVSLGRPARAEEALRQERATLPTPAAMTRTQAVDFALLHSPLLSAANARVASAQGSLQSAGAPPPPQLAPSISVGGEGRTLVLAQTIETSGRRGPRRRVALSELSAAERSGDVARLDVVRTVNRAYSDLAQAQQRQVLFTEVAGIVRRTRDSIRKQVEVGANPAVDLLKTETELARAESDGVRAEAEKETNRAVLNTVMGRAADAPLEASEPVAFVPVPLDSAALTQQASAYRPELGAAEARVSAALENVRLQRADYRPDVNVGLLEDTNLSGRSFLNPRSTGVSVGLSMPLFDTGRIRGQIRRAEAQVREQEALREQARLDVLREVGSALASVRATEMLAGRYDKDILPRSQELLNKAEFGFQRGGSNLLEYLEAQRTYRNTRSEYLIILGDNARARTELERAIGGPLRPRS